MEHTLCSIVRLSTQLLFLAQLLVVVYFSDRNLNCHYDYDGDFGIQMNFQNLHTFNQQLFFPLHFFHSSAVHFHSFYFDVWLYFFVLCGPTRSTRGQGGQGTPSSTYYYISHALMRTSCSQFLFKKPNIHSTRLAQKKTTNTIIKYNNNSNGSSKMM